MSLTFKNTLMAGTFGLTLMALPATAQDYGYSDTAYAAPPESVTVIAPEYRVEQHGLQAPSKISLSRQVAFDDIDLRSPDGADELKYRVADAARDVCARLQDASPAPQLYGTSCYRDALHNAEVKADAAIREARYERYDRYDDRY